jgi:PKD repeat protein
LLLLMSFTDSVLAQTFLGENVPFQSPILDKKFTNWEMYRLDASLLGNTVRAKSIAEVRLQLGQHDWNISLSPSYLRSKNYTHQVLRPDGTIEIIRPTKEIAFKGYTTAGGHVRLTIDDNFIHGFIKDGAETWYIQSARHIDRTAADDLFIVYAESAVLPVDGVSCATDEDASGAAKYFGPGIKQNNTGTESMACFEAEIAMAADRSMFNKYGGSAGVDAHTSAVLNDVQGNFTNGQFTHSINFVVVTSFTVSGTDPWTNSTDAGTLLNSFANWGNANGFGIGNSFDVASLWTDRDFNGGTIGIAFVNGLCNSGKYNCLQDFTGNGNLLRVLHAHELGHNFNCLHDPAGCSNFIMCPTVSTATQWSTSSINAANSAIAARNGAGGCLSPCGGGGGNTPPIADFSWSPSPACTGQQIQFTNTSTGTFTTVAWQFPSGTPSSSNINNPVVTWNTPGIFTVRITVNGPNGSSTITQPVTILAAPVPNFNFSVNNLRVTFTNTTTGTGNTYSWDFGDGNTSAATNPVHNYAIGGTYTVVLTVTSACGNFQVSKTINTIPTAIFQADPTSGCNPLTVNYINQSSNNATSFLWTFPGGTPGTSTQPNPTVVYANPGTYNVTLQAINSVGSNTYTAPAFISVQATAFAAFTYTVNNRTVTFTNTSTNASSYLWDFGNGQTSTQASPTITYATSGTYAVLLTATGACGPATFLEVITINAAPVASFTATPMSGCSPLTVQFNNTTTGNATAYSWQFPGGTPATSTDANPAVVYNNPGNYSVTLTATNSAGTNTFSRNNYIAAAPAAAADFSFTVNNRTVAFQNASVNATGSAWNFGNNTTSTATNPTVTYAADGVYTVVLTISSACGPILVSKDVTILTPPTAGFNANQTSGCGPLTVQYASTASANATTFNWQFPGGTPATSTAQNPTVVYNTSGAYSVTFTAGNAAGNTTATQTNYITVNGAPGAGFTEAIDNRTVTFNNTTTNGTTYSWNFGDNNTASTANPVHTYAADGTYTVILSASNNCGTTTFTRTVVVSTLPSAGFTVTNSTGCAPFIVQFSNTSSANSTGFSWQFPGGTPAVSTAQNPSVLYSAPGTYSVTLTVSNSAGTATSVQNNIITVPALPTPVFAPTVTNRTAVFANTSSNATAFSWSFGDGNSSTQATPTHTYAADGSYTVVLTATNGCGSTTATQTVVIATPPVAGFTASNTSGCSPLTVQYTSTSSANSTTFNWQFPGGTPATSTAQNPIVTYPAAGTYSAVLTVSNAVGNNTSTQNAIVTVNTTPVTAFSATTNGLSATFANTSSNATAFSWNFGDGNSSTQATPTHTYATDGSYTVVLTATNGCGSTTATRTVVIATPPVAGFTASNTSGCSPLTVQYTSTSSANSTSFNWQFPGGTPATSTAQNPTVTYPAADTYSAVLTVSNAVGNNTSTQNAIVTVNTTPVAAFSATTNGLSATFANTSSNATVFSWNFGDGNSSTQATPTHTYAADGSYTVVLTATNGCGSTTSTQTVVIATPPVAGFTASNTSGCSPLTVQYTSTSSANSTTFNWQFPGGTPATSTTQNPTVTYQAAGTYSAVLTVSNAVGNNTSTQNDIVIVNAGPTALFSSSVSSRTAVFSNNSANATSYSWSFGDGNTSTEATPSHTYAADGTYTVVLSATNACGTNTFTQNVLIVTSPTAGFTVNTTIGCGPLDVQFTDLSSSNTTSWAWSFPGGSPATSTERNPVVNYATPGTYSVTLIASTAAGNSTFERINYITVTGPPTVGFTPSVSGQTVSLVNTSSNALAYIWNMGDGTTLTSANPTYTYLNGGTYTVSLTAANACGTASASTPVVIAGPPPTGAFTNTPGTHCGPVSVSFSDQSAGAPTSWLWSFPGGTPSASTQQNPTVFYGLSGTFAATLIVTNSSGSDTVTVPGVVTIQPLPVANFAVGINGATVTFTNLTANVTSVLWDFGDGITSTAGNPSHTYTTSGTYTVKLTVTNNCGTNTVERNIQVTIVGVENLANEWNVQVYPNPGNGNFTLSASGLSADEMQVQVYNTLGQLAGRTVLPVVNGNIYNAVNYSYLPSGVYTLQLKVGKKTAVKKLIID